MMKMTSLGKGIGDVMENESTEVESQSQSPQDASGDGGAVGHNNNVSTLESTEVESQSQSPQDADSGDGGTVGHNNNVSTLKSTEVESQSQSSLDADSGGGGTVGHNNNVNADEDFVENGVGNTTDFGVLDPNEEEQTAEKNDEQNERGEKVHENISKYETAKADENVEIMKAAAGYDLVETIAGEDSRPVKILYMTNKQAVRVAKDSTAMRKMEMALFGDNPRYLIIDLVQSWGFYNSTKIMHKQYFENTKQNKWNAGIKYASRPFRDVQEDQEAVNQINQFMLNVIIPLAEKTSAIVVCNAVVNDCILAECFTNMVESMSTKWDGEPPFAIVGILGSVDVLYHNKRKDATWENIRVKCNAWKKRHEGVLNTYFQESTSPRKEGYHHDLCWTTSKLVVIEGLDTGFDEKKSWAKKNKAPFSLFITKLRRLIGENAPQLAFKTGACTRDDHVQKKHYRGIQDMSYRNLLDRINAGASIVCLDVRKREYAPVSNQAQTTDDQITSAAGKPQDTTAIDHGQAQTILIQTDPITSVAGITQDTTATDHDQEAQTILNQTDPITSEAGIPQDTTATDHDQAQTLMNQPVPTNTVVDKNAYSKALEKAQRFFKVVTKKEEESDNKVAVSDKKKYKSEDKIKDENCVLRKRLKKIQDTFYQDSSQYGGPSKEALDCCLLAHLSHRLEVWKEEKAEMKQKDPSKGGLSNWKIFTKKHEKGPKTLAETIQKLKEEIERHDKKDHQSSLNYDLEDPEIDFAAFANRFAWEFYKNLPLPDDCEDDEATRRYFVSEIQTTASFVMQLLMSKNFQSMNIWDTPIRQEAIIDKIVLSAFETNSSLEGLELLKKAWEAVDNSRDLATKYLNIANKLYLSQLTLGFLLTFVSVMVGYEIFPQAWEKVVLWLSLALGVFASIDTILSPRSYWYQLRRSQVALESIIWQYRTRVGQFEVDRTNSNKHRPVQNLRIQLRDWGDELVAGSKNTSATGVHGKQWGKLIFDFFGKKSKKSCEVIEENGDDHYSYVDGKRYVKWRVEPLIKQYQSKIPRGLFFQYKHEITIVILGVAIAIVSAQVKKKDVSSAVVAILTAVVAFLTSWIEFLGVTKEANLLSSAIQECNNQVYRWTELTKFMAQSRNITNVLVEEVEKIVMEVMTSWSTSISKKSQTTNEGDMKSNDPNGNGRHVLFPLRNIREQPPVDLTD